MKTFTVAEAEALLPVVRTVVGQIVELSQLVPELEDEARIRTYQAARAGEAVGEEAAELRRQRESDLRDAQLSLQTFLVQLDAMGVVLKDVQTGLVDFPSIRDGELIELCWKLGEDSVAHWHRIGEGFAGRKPL